jgi:hydrogenase-4 component F
MILKQTIASASWWLIALIVLMLCVVVYSICFRIIKLCYQPNQDELHLTKINRRLSYSALSLLVAAIVLGVWQPEILKEFITNIVTF